MALSIPDDYPSLFSVSEEEEETSDNGRNRGRKSDNNKDKQSLKWGKIEGILQANPNALTLDLFLSTLARQPPPNIVERFLSQPNLQKSLLPEQGPTPLQVAVRQGCHATVVQLLILENPFALVFTAQGQEEDPLSLAKRHWMGRRDLVELLERPLTDWLEESNRRKNSSSNNNNNSNFEWILQPKHSWKQVQEQELSNVKLLCARLLKKNMQLAKEVSACELAIQAMQCKHDTQNNDLKILSASQETTFICGEKVVHQRLSTIDRGLQDMVTWREQLDSKMNQWELLLEDEATVNEVFRIDLVKWKDKMEEQLIFAKNAPLLGHRIDERERNLPTREITANSKENVAPKHADRPKKRLVCRPFNIIM